MRLARNGRLFLGGQPQAGFAEKTKWKMSKMEGQRLSDWKEIKKTKKKKKMEKKKKDIKPWMENRCENEWLNKEQC